MIDKSISIKEAVAHIPDGAVIAIGGFGVPGTPFCLINELVRQGQKELVLIKNDANEVNMGIDHLLQNGQVKKLITSHIGLNQNAVKMMNDNILEIEFSAQGILAERLRTAGAGLDGFLTDVGVDTKLSEGKAIIEFQGKKCLIEQPLKADFAFVHAHRADPFGNLIYAGTAQNFNPLMAMAADYVIAEVEETVCMGDLVPETIHTPGPFVDQLVILDELTEEYNVVQR